MPLISAPKQKTLISAQVCVSTQPFYQAYVLSETTPGQVYTVTVAMPGDPSSEYTCTCKGFTHRGYCKHQGWITVCKWNASIGPEKQSDEQQAEHICPRCGNDTIEELQLEYEH